MSKYDKIFLSGPCGTGKTTLVEHFTQEWQEYFPRLDVISAALATKPDANFEERQDIILSTLISLNLSSGRFICDRSVFDVLLWSMQAHNNYQYDKFKEVLTTLRPVLSSSLYVIVPSPTWQQCRDLIFPNILSSPKRLKAYQEIFPTIDWTVSTATDILFTHVRTSAYALTSFISRWNEEEEAKVNYVIPQESDTDFFLWTDSFLELFRSVNNQ